MSKEAEVRSRSREAGEVGAAIIADAIAELTAEVRRLADHLGAVWQATLDIPPPGPGSFEWIDIPVVNGIATLPGGQTVRSSSQVVRVPRLTLEALSPLGHGTPVPEEATLPSGDARVAAL